MFSYIGQMSCKLGEFYLMGDVEDVTNNFAVICISEAGTGTINSVNYKNTDMRQFPIVLYFCHVSLL
jgi:hypothetical protein